MTSSHTNRGDSLEPRGKDTTSSPNEEGLYEYWVEKWSIPDVPKKASDNIPKSSQSGTYEKGIGSSVIKSPDTSKEGTRAAGPMMIILGVVFLLIGIISFCSASSGYSESNPVPSSVSAFPILLFFVGIFLLGIGIYRTSADVAKGQDKVMSQFLADVPADKRDHIGRVVEKQMAEDRAQLERWFTPPRDRNE